MAMLTIGDVSVPGPTTNEEVANAVGSITPMIELTSQEYECTDNFIQHMGVGTSSLTTPPPPPPSSVMGGLAGDDEASHGAPPVSRLYTSSDEAESAFSTTTADEDTGELKRKKKRSRKLRELQINKMRGGSVSGYESDEY